MSVIWRWIKICATGFGLIYGGLLLAVIIAILTYKVITFFKRGKHDD